MGNAGTPEIIRVLTASGKTVEFENKVAAQGGTKHVYFSPDKSYVVAFYFKGRIDEIKARLKEICGAYREKIFDPSNYGEHWKSLFCWPTDYVEWNGKIGVVCPTYPPQYLFREGLLKNKEKKGKWFAAPRLREKMLSPSDKGDWCSYLRLCNKIARAVRRLHAAGLAHSDLSFNNVLIDPETGSACVIDIDGLVVPGKFASETLGTGEFIAPEVLASMRYEDCPIIQPSAKTDRHALAVLIYQYLLRRHPLQGGRVCDPDDASNDEMLSMGEMALFIEHPSDASNRPNHESLKRRNADYPSTYVDKLPYTLCGPYLSKLFEKAFIDGLHEPKNRPRAEDWELAILKTIDTIQRCPNPDCEDRWFPYVSGDARCPFCGMALNDEFPVLDLFYKTKKSESYLREEHTITVYSQINLYKWHTDHYAVANETIKDSEKQPLADIQFFRGHWLLINRHLSGLAEVAEDGTKNVIPENRYIVLYEGTKILFSDDASSRMAIVRFCNTGPGGTRFVKPSS